MAQHFPCWMPTKDRPWIRERRPTLARTDRKTRQRPVKLSARFSEEEAATVRGMADRTGTSVASLIRCAVLGQPLSRATRHPTISHDKAVRLLAALGRLTDAYHEAAAAAPDNGKYDALIEAAYRDLCEMRLVWFQAMGREP